MEKKPGKSCKPSMLTLTELLGVIVVIAILAMLPAALNAAKQKAQLVFCQSNLKPIGLSMAMYENDYAMYPVGSLHG